ncbi:MAG: SpoIID/LytB domain-containing protein, partial [Bacteroidales bacterium]|nr:SpoIID/LytB domain-containing protein [Candidatus Cacconaster equifaecalis]
MELAVGIVSLEKLAFKFRTPYTFGDRTFSGSATACVKEGKIFFDGALYDEVIFRRPGADGSFELGEVTIGVDFHWNRRETQIFPGDLKLIVDSGRLTAINLVDIEDYLVSVISSEMSATCSLNLLKAHCIISRSWVISQIVRRVGTSAAEGSSSAQEADDDSRMIKWYDRQDHVNFDVCADDHCQRYYGLSRATTPTVRKAVEETCGLV